MNAKTLMTTALAGLLATAAHAITSDEIAAALDVDPSVGTFSCSGSADWYVDTSISATGTACMRSGAINPTGSDEWMYSRLAFSVNVSKPSYLSFWVKTSSYGNDYGALNVIIDNASTLYYGETEWKKVSFVLIPGVHSIVMSFQRYHYYSYSAGMNCSWVDGLSITPFTQEQSTVTVSNIKCAQRTPWNGKVDIDYTVACDKENADIWVYPVGYDKDTGKTMAPRALEGDGVNAPVKAGTHRMTWTVTEDYPNFNSTAFTVKMTALVGAAPYMVIDLSGGVDALAYPVTYLSSVPAGGWENEYKTTKLVLRLIPSGSFWMGSPSDEDGRWSNEELHGVVLTKPYYIGVFECTQKQYELVMGSNPVGSSSYKGDARPVTYVSYNNIRGSVNGIGWPTHNQVDADSFMGRLRSKVNMLFDLPTEAQWEYACRAGAGQALYSGKAYSEAAIKEIARNTFNSGRNGNYPSDNKGGYPYMTTVGSYVENAWGLYDMIGNVAELCRDNWNGSLGYNGVIDPNGASTPYKYYSSSDYAVHAVRGGSWVHDSACRSAWRDCFDRYMCYGSNYDYVGFRVYCSPVAQ